MEGLKNEKDLLSDRNSCNKKSLCDSPFPDSNKNPKMDNKNNAGYNSDDSLDKE